MAQQGGYNQSGYGRDDRYNQQAGNPYAQSGNPYTQQQASSPYAQQQSNPYTQQQSNPYTQQQANPYAQQQNNGHGQQAGNRYAQQSDTQYGQQRPQAGGYVAGSDDVEMGQMNGQRPAQNGEYTLLDEVNDIRRAVQSLTQRNFPNVRALQQSVLDDPKASTETEAHRQLDSLDADTMAAFRNFTERVNKLKARQGAGNSENAPSIKSVQNMLGKELTNYQEIKNEHRKKCEEQIERQLRYVKADVTQEEIQEAIENGGQVFAQQIQQSTRLGQSRAILNNLNGRHQDIQKLERQVTDMAQMFQDLNRLVVAQEEQVANINQRAEETAEHVRKGAGETVIAVDSARAARRKKWICFWIVVAIILIAAAIIGIVVGITHKGS